MPASFRARTARTASSTVSPATKRRAAPRAKGASRAILRASRLSLRKRKVSRSKGYGLPSGVASADRRVELRLGFVQGQFERGLAGFGLGLAVGDVTRFHMLEDRASRAGPAQEDEERGVRPVWIPGRLHVHVHGIRLTVHAFERGGPTVLPEVTTDGQVGG